MLRRAITRMEPLKHFPPSKTLPLPLVVLAGFGDEEAAEVRALLADDCRVTTARSAPR